MRRPLRFASELVLPAQNVVSGERAWTDLFGEEFGGTLNTVLAWQPSGDQVRFFDVVRQGRDTLFQVGTGGGKTVTVMVWLLSQVARHCQSAVPWCAVVLLPTSSLLDDFHSRLLALAEALHLQARILRYGGEAKQAERREMRRSCTEADVILMTPDMFVGTLLRNYAIGQGQGDDHEQWAMKLLTADALVVEEVDALDERTLVRLRLLLKILRKKTRRIRPLPIQTVVTSATIPNGEEVAGALLEQGVVVRGGGRHGEIHIWVRPRQVGETDDALELLLEDLLTGGGPETLRFGVFWENKCELERLSQRLHLAARGVGLITGDIEKRRNQATLRDFKDGRLRGLCFTSISSRGIDIGGLRVLILVGLSPRLVELFQAVGRTARTPEERGFVYHLLDVNDPVQRELLEHPEQLVGLYQRGPPPLHLPDASEEDVEFALALALSLNLCQRASLESWFGPLTRRAVLRLRVAGHLAYQGPDYVAGPSLEEFAHVRKLRQFPPRFTVLTTDGQPVGHLDTFQVARQGLPGSLVVLGQRVFRVVALNHENVLVEPVPAVLAQCYSVNRLESQVHLALKSRQRLGPATLALVEVHRFWSPTVRELQKAEAGETILRTRIPPPQRVTVSQQGEGLLLENVGDKCPLDILEIVLAALSVTAFPSPGASVEMLVVGGRLLLAERVGGCSLIRPVFETLHQHLTQAVKRLAALSVEDCAAYLLPALQAKSRATPEKVSQAIRCIEAMVSGNGTGNRGCSW